MAAVTLWQAVLLAAAANVVGAWFAAVFAFWNGHYFVPGAAFALGLGVVLLIPLIVIALARIEEIAHDRLRPQAAAADRRRRRWCRDARPRRRKCRSTFRPTTSRRRCSSKRSMRWRASTIRISNAWWSSTTRPIRRCGGRSRSIAARSASASSSSTPRTLQGFKAGALRLALAHTAADAEIIGVHRRRLRRAAGLAQGSGAAVRRCRRSAWSRRRRITATASAA